MFGIGRMMKSFLNPGKGYEKAGQQMEKYYNQGQGYLQPYNQRGQEVYPQLTGAMNKLLNPAQLYDEFLNNYHMSDAAKFGQERARQNAMNAASSMGLMGSSPALQSVQAGMDEAAAKDEQLFIERMIQQYVQGAGLAQNIYGVGGNTAGAMSNNAINQGNNAAEMTFGRYNAPGQLFGSLLGTSANLAGSYMGMKGMNNMANSWKSKV